MKRKSFKERVRFLEKIKEIKNERNYRVGDHRRDLVSFAGLHPAKIRDFHLTERFLSGDKQ